jgi:uroporphyrin-III C-methyltransferase
VTVARVGTVRLVGAGPGDPELLTLKAVRAIASADVILHDALVDRAVLAHARVGARIVEVGKRGGCASTPQAFIGQLMIREARAGFDVVRLKGGDPFVFGRGGEELDELAAAGIAVEIVPGITSGLAAPASIGIPVTHRDCAHGVALVTGHAADARDEPDWAALRASRLTVVIYMGMANAGAIAAKLARAGWLASTPVAVIARATRTDQADVVTTVGDLEPAIRAGGLASPAIIVVGEVAARAQTRETVSTAPRGLRPAAETRLARA